MEDSSTLHCSLVMTSLLLPPSLSAPLPRSLSPPLSRPFLLLLRSLSLCGKSLAEAQECEGGEENAAGSWERDSRFGVAGFRRVPGLLQLELGSSACAHACTLAHARGKPGGTVQPEFNGCRHFYRTPGPGTGDTHSSNREPERCYGGFLGDCGLPVTVMTRDLPVHGSDCQCTVGESRAPRCFYARSNLWFCKIEPALRLTGLISGVASAAVQAAACENLKDSEREDPVPAWCSHAM
eukprot:3074414-Rhodomonas_salina.1